MADVVRLLDLQRGHQRDDIGASDVLAVARGVVGDVRRRIAALTVSNAPMGAAEPAYLRLPRAVVSGKFVDEDDRRAAAGFFVIEIDAVAGSDLRHCNLSSFGSGIKL